MWHPDPQWTPLRAGAATQGIWTAQWQGDPCVVKRFSAPGPGDPAYRNDPGHVGYWRRAADVAESGLLVATSGLRALPALQVEADPEGVTLWESPVEPAHSNAVYLAQALGRFATTPAPDVPWLARAMLADRLALVDEREGWRTLARTTLADIADALWSKRGHYLSACGPLVLSHGDATPANLPGRDGDAVVGIDWDALGVAPLGSDVGYLALSAKEDFTVLLTAYADGGGWSLADVWTGAAVMATYTAFTRAEWALARAAAGPGALAGKFNHPSVAPALRTLQRLAPVVEELLTR